MSNDVKIRRFMRYALIGIVLWADAISASPFDVRATTAFTEQARLASPDTFSQYGFSAAISGDTAIVGLPSNTPQNVRSGAALIYVRSGATWSQQAQLLASDPAADARFGSAVAITGDTAFVGASNRAAGGFDTGVVYVFTRSSGVWTQSARLRPADDAVQFGTSMAVSGNTLLVGSFGSGGYVYTGSGASWTQQARLNTSDVNPGNNGSRGGLEVSISGDTAVLGNGSESSLTGGAFVFIRTGGSWTRQAILLAPEANSVARFGLAVAVSGDSVLVGAPNDRPNGVIGAGAVYPYTRRGGVWTQGSRLLAPNLIGGEQFGRRLSMINDRAIANATPITRVGNSWTLDTTLSTSDGALAVPAAVAIQGTSLIMTRSSAASYVFNDASAGDLVFRSGFE
jgi:FG-GAP repeat